MGTTKSETAILQHPGRLVIPGFEELKIDLGGLDPGDRQAGFLVSTRCPILMWGCGVTCSTPSTTFGAVLHEGAAFLGIQPYPRQPVDLSVFTQGGRGHADASDDVRQPLGMIIVPSSDGSYIPLKIVFLDIVEGGITYYYEKEDGPGG